MYLSSLLKSRQLLEVSGVAEGAVGEEGFRFGCRYGAGEFCPMFFWGYSEVFGVGRGRDNFGVEETAENFV